MTEPRRSRDAYHDATTIGEREHYDLGAHRMQLAIAARLNNAGLYSAAAMALATPLPDPRSPAPERATGLTGLEERGG